MTEVPAITKINTHDQLLKFCKDKLEREGIPELPIIKEGMLSKQGQIVKNWKQRWFVLRNNKLYYKKAKVLVPIPVHSLTKENRLIRDSLILFHYKPWVPLEVL